MKCRDVKVVKQPYFVCCMILALTFLCIGCQDQELSQGELSNDAITFALYNIGDDNLSSSSKKRAVEKPIILVNEDGTDSLALYLTIADTIDWGEPILHADKDVTRGTPINNDNMVSKCSGEIALDAFYKNETYIEDVILLNSLTDVHTQVVHYWPIAKDAKISFWSYHPKEIDEAADAAFTINNDAASPSLSFYYNQEGSDSKLVDVKEQKDLFLAYAHQGKEQGKVNLQYNHALSAIRFIAGKVLAGTVENISLSDVYAAGKLTYQPNQATKLTWELDNSSKSTLDQDLNVEIKENMSGTPTQPITSDANETTFLLIPQPTTGKILTITYLRPDGVHDVYKATMPDGAWEIGKAYTYTLKLMDGLSIEATAENVVNKVINGVEITNTYNKPCYVRAMIVGNWVDEADNVAALFNPNEVNLKITAGNSNYERATNWDTYWLYDETANVYYYKKPLLSTKHTEVRLFNKFTNPITHADGLELDFVVLVQAVEAEADKTSVKAAWGNTVADQLDPL